jgi:hypothetical protein
VLAQLLQRWTLLNLYLNELSLILPATLSIQITLMKLLRRSLQILGLTVRKVSDRTFLLHLGGKIEVASKVPLKTRDDLSRAYTPGVARICQAIAADPSDARRLTIKRNTVAVVTDGSAVLRPWKYWSCRCSSSDGR